MKGNIDYHLLTTYPIILNFIINVYGRNSVYFIIMSFYQKINKSNI